MTPTCDRILADVKLVGHICWKSDLGYGVQRLQVSPIVVFLFRKKFADT